MKSKFEFAIKWILVIALAISAISVIFNAIREDFIITIASFVSFLIFFFLWVYLEKE